MNYLILVLCLIISLIPIIVVGRFFYKKDTIKEPKELLKKLFFSGFISVIIVIFVSLFEILLFPFIAEPESITNSLLLVIYSYILVALIEELSKFLMIYLLGYKSKYFDQEYDIILYSIFVGLGFAFFENIIYILSNPSITISLLRGITAVPAHITFQIIMGYYILLSKNKKSKKYLILSILIPIILHGTYDFLIFKNSVILLIIDIIFLIIIFYLELLKINKIIKNDKDDLVNFCPNCKIKINYQYCPNCGYKKSNN